jgi:hypothetical protein
MLRKTDKNIAHAPADPEMAACNHFFVLIQMRAMSSSFLVSITMLARTKVMFSAVSRQTKRFLMFRR